MNILVLRLFLKYAEASGRLQDPFEEVWEEFKLWKYYTIDIESTSFDSECEILTRAINDIDAIINNGFCIHFDSPYLL